MPESTGPLFVALPLPEALKAALESLPRPPVQATWARAEGLHLTLAFLGARPEGGIAPLADLLAEVASHHASFLLRTAALGGFPSLGHARILWLGVAEEPRLTSLAGDLRRRLEGAGIPFDAKPFVPHLTLARMKTPSDLRRLPSPPGQAFPADRLVLYRSLRLADGARYEPLAEARMLASSFQEGEP